MLLFPPPAGSILIWLGKQILHASAISTANNMQRLIYLDTRSLGTVRHLPRGADPARYQRPYSEARICPLCGKNKKRQ